MSPRIPQKRDTGTPSLPAESHHRNSTTKQQKPRKERTGYSHLDEEEGLESCGTELVLIPRVQGQVERKDTSYKGKASTTPGTKRRGLGSLLKRGNGSGTPGTSSSVPFQELPVLAMSFEDSVELKNSTDDTGQSEDSGNFKSKGQQWNPDGESTGSSYDDGDFLMPHYGGRSRKKWKIVFWLVFLVIVCLSIGLPIYYFMVVGDNDVSEENVQPNTMDECENNVFEPSLFSKRYTEMRKVIRATTEGDPEMVDQPRSAQRKALCWISEVDTIIEEVNGDSIPAILQRYTLAVTYYSLVVEGDESERSLKSTDFLSSAHECEWSVIMCSSPRTVSALLLADKDLTGSLPAEIANLRGLCKLTRHDCYLFRGLFKTNALNSFLLQRFWS